MISSSWGVTDKALVMRTPRIFSSVWLADGIYFEQLVTAARQLQRNNSKYGIFNSYEVTNDLALCTFALSQVIKFFYLLHLISIFLLLNKLPL